MEIIVDAFLDALIDGVKMLPFLYLAYLLIEWLERNHGERIEKALAGGGHWGFVPGALLGCVPQCGFSAVAANFYASRVITPGTLLAVFLATSDEAIPLLAAEPTLWNKLGLLLVLKIVFGIAAGLVLDVPLRRILPKGLYGGYEGHSDPYRMCSLHECRGYVAHGHCADESADESLPRLLGVHLGVQLYHWADLWLCRGRFRRGISGKSGHFPAHDGRADRSCTQLRCQRAAGSAVYGRGYYLWQFFCGAVLRRRYRPGCAVACQPQLETELVHDRAALVLRHLLRYFAAMGGVRTAGGHNP